MATKLFLMLGNNRPQWNFNLFILPWIVVVAAATPPDLCNISVPVTVCFCSVPTYYRYTRYYFIYIIILFTEIKKNCDKRGGIKNKSTAVGPKKNWNISSQRRDRRHPRHEKLICLLISSFFLVNWCSSEVLYTLYINTFIYLYIMAATAVFSFVNR